MTPGSGASRESETRMGHRWCWRKALTDESDWSAGSDVTISTHTGSPELDVPFAAHAWGRVSLQEGKVAGRCLKRRSGDCTPEVTTTNSTTDWASRAYPTSEIFVVEKSGVAGYLVDSGRDETGAPCGVQTASTANLSVCESQADFGAYQGIAVYDLVRLSADGGETSNVLKPGDIGQVIQDRRCGSAPFKVLGPRGESGWFRGESLVPYIQRRSRSDSEKLESWRWKPLIQQVVEALDPDRRLDFPKITDICEAAAHNAASADVALAVLVATLGEQKFKPGDERSITLDYLKVLTIFNEMLHDDQVADVLRRAPGLKPALERLREFHSGDQGDTTDENIRMLATEVERCVFQATGRAQRPTARTEIIAFCPRGHLLIWVDGIRFHIRQRECACCHKVLNRTTQRYVCQRCTCYNVCVSCTRWGAPVQSQTFIPATSSATLEIVGTPDWQRSITD